MTLRLFPSQPSKWMNPVKGMAHYIGCVGSDDNAQLLKSAAEAAGVKTHYNVPIPPLSS